MVRLATGELLFARGDVSNPKDAPPITNEPVVIVAPADDEATVAEPAWTAASLLIYIVPPPPSVTAA